MRINHLPTQPVRRLHHCSVLAVSIALMATVFFSSLSLQATEDQNSATSPTSEKVSGESTSPNPHPLATPGDYLKRVVFDQRDIWTSPAQIRPRTFRWLVPLAGLTASSIAFDSSITRQFVGKGQHLKLSNNISNAGAGALGAITVGLFASGMASQNPRLKETGILASEAAIAGLIFAAPVRLATGRERPQLPSGTADFGSSGQAFPSNHAVASWALASVIAHEYPGWATQLGVYGLAGATSFARVTAGKHSLSDVLVGSAAGYLIGRHTYGKYHDENLGGASSEPTHYRDPNAVVPAGTTYVPVDSWLYIAFDRLAALGYTNSQSASTRPWTRQEFYRLLVLAENAVADQMGDESPQAVSIIESAKREFAWEDKTQDIDTPVMAELESVYFRYLNVSDTPLSRTHHFGETIINDYGRPYAEGSNVISGFTSRAVAGRFSLYVRGEYQHAPSAPALDDSVRTFIGVADLVPKPAATPFDEVNRFRLLESYVGVNYANIEWTVGKQSLWWGPTRSGPLLFSNNAEPIYMLRVQPQHPFRLPGAFGALGYWNLDFFFGHIAGYKHPERPMIHGEKISWHLTDNLEMGFTRTVFFGGVGFQPLTLGTFGRTFFSVDSNAPAGGSKDPGDRRGGFDFSYRVPKLRNWLTVYTDSFTDDDVSPLAAEHRAAFNPGIYMPRLPKLPKFDLRLEGVYTNVPGKTNAFGRFVYFNNAYLDSYASNGQILGDWIGRNSTGYQGWLTYWHTPEQRIQLNYRGAKISSDYVPGGGTQHDVSLSADWLVGKAFRIGPQVQYENWLIPLLKTQRQNDWSGSVQLTFDVHKGLARGTR